jgi:HEPN domain-containing protein
MSINVEEQVTYWQKGALEELDTAELLLNNNKINQGLFWAHLALEKALKALVTRQTGATPPFIHDLVRLADLAAIPIDAEQRAFFASCNRFAIHGRYEVPLTSLMTGAELADTWHKIKEAVKWLLTL